MRPASKLWRFHWLAAIALAACGGGGGDDATMAVMASPAAAAAKTTNAPAKAAPSLSPLVYDWVLLDPDLIPGIGNTSGSAGSLSINATGQVAFTSSGVAAGGRFYDGSSIQVLPTLGGAITMPSAVNDAGQVTGSSYTAAAIPHAFRWTPGAGAGTMLDLAAPGAGNSTGMAINANGRVAGMSGPSIAARAFSWTEGVGMTDLGTLGAAPLSQDYAIAFLINASGQVAGVSSSLQGPQYQRGFMWSPAGGMRDLGTLGGGNTYVKSLNDLGQVAGASALASELPHAFVWDAAQGMRDLGTLGGQTSFAFAMNNAGQVAGEAAVPVGTQGFALSHAFFWDPAGSQAGVLVDLGTLGGGASIALAMNDSAQVVGRSDLASGGSHAFVWTAQEGMVDLNTRLRPAAAALELTAAFAISQNGSILAASDRGLVLLKARSGAVTGSANLASSAGEAKLTANVKAGSAGAKPSGRTRFEVRAAGFDFESTGYDWLNVYAGQARFKGSGTLNGAAGFQFTATVADGGGGASPDRVNIRIWHLDAVTGAQVVDFESPATGVLTGTGNLVVHEEG